MSGIFPPRDRNGSPPGGNVCNGLTPTHPVIGEGPLYYKADCTTVLTDCAANSLISEILGAVDGLGKPYNANRVDNLGIALRDTVADLITRINERILRSGDTMTGPLNVVCPPTEPPEATCKQYVDDQDTATAAAVTAALTALFEAADQVLLDNINTRVRRDGDQMTGPLILSGDPTVDDGAATRRYVDAQRGYIVIAPEPPTDIPPNRLWWSSTDGVLYVRFDDGSSVQWVAACGPCDVGDGNGAGPGGNFLPISGGALTGDLQLFRDPIGPLNAVTKVYVDQEVLTLRNTVTEQADTIDELTRRVEDLTSRVETLEQRLAGIGGA